MATTTQLLGSIPLFSACSRPQLRQLARLADRVVVEEGDELATEGTVGRHFFVIDRGKATVTIGRKKVATLGPGQFFGEMSLLDQQPRLATVTAATPMVLYIIQDKDFAAFLDESPVVLRQILKGVAERVREVEKSPTYAWKN